MSGTNEESKKIQVCEEVLPTENFNSPTKEKGINSSISAQISSPNFFKTPLQEKISPSINKKVCNCKHSKCLKLYCECFSVGEYCSSSCNCFHCCNKKEWEYIRRESIQSILIRNPNAFRSKIQTPINRKAVEIQPSSIKHSKGCCCRKSYCLKKYCECYNAGIFCAEICKCSECKNFEGSVDRRLTVLSDLRNKEAELHTDKQVFLSKISYNNLPSSNYKKYFKQNDEKNFENSNREFFSCLGLSKLSDPEIQEIKNERNLINEINADLNSKILGKMNHNWVQLKLSEFFHNGIEILKDSNSESNDLKLIQEMNESLNGFGKI